MYKIDKMYKNKTKINQYNKMYRKVVKVKVSICFIFRIIVRAD